MSVRKFKALKHYHLSTTENRIYSHNNILINTLGHKLILMKKIKLTFLLLVCWCCWVTAHSNTDNFRPETVVVCNNSVQVSMDEDCLVPVTADMVLEGSTEPDDAYTIELYSDGELLPAAVITAGEVGQTLGVHVIHTASGNYCWGEIVVEDKFNPIISCPDTAFFTCLDLAGLLDGSIGVEEPAAEDNCNDAALSFEDSVAEDFCDGTIITRSWIATDPSGNNAACEQIISLSPLSLADVETNGEVTLSCDQLDVAPTPENLETAGVEGAYPTIASEGITYNVLDALCNIGATYEDAPAINICGGGHKIIRSWTLYDWCTAESLTYTQIIKVEDLDGPVINTCPEYGTIAASNIPGECTGIIVIQDLTDFTENCSNPTSVSVQITMESGDVVDANVGDQVQAGVGTHDLTYIITDACGNESTCNTVATIEDQTPPVTICDEHTIASVGSDGVAEICWDTFDDGSYDNCGPIILKVKRMDAPAGAQFSDCAQFDCSDIGSTIWVRMRGYDITPDNGFPDDDSGRWNECMVEVEVQDKLNPIINCPPNKIVECQTAFAELDQIIEDEDGVLDSDAHYPAVYYGGEFQGYFAGGYDNCSAVIEVSDQGELDQCGEGTIVRTWLITDAGDRTDVCTQIIEVINDDPFNENDIDWPNDASVNCGNGTEPDDLPNGRQRPSFNEDACDLVAVTYEDQYLPVVDSACYKILRTWTILDWCQFDSNETPNPGVWSFIQIIKVQDEDAPEITSPLEDATVCSYTNDCSEAIEFSLEATDECSDELSYHLFIDGYADGNVATTATVNLPQGTHEIVWTVTDGCGNETVGQYNLTVVDCKKPTPVCINGLATVIMPTSGEITLWASDFNAPDGSGSFDNCTAQEDLELRIRKVVEGNATLTTAAQVLALGSDVVFTCEDLGFPNVELYVVDQEGNFDYCTTYALIEDNNAVCNLNELSAIEGHAETEMEEMVEDVNVTVTGGTGAVPAFLTNASGAYGFEVPANGNYTVTPAKETNVLNGVTTFDLVLISKHILGNQALDSPYKIIAADANASNSITTFDLVLIRQLILNITNEFPTNTSWRFVDKDFAFPNPANPFATTFPETISFNSLSSDELTADFISVKVGDVNSSAIPNALLGTQNRTRANDLLLAVNDQALEAGEEYTVDFMAKDFKDILGYQFTLNFDKTLVEVIDVVPGTLNKLSEANFGLTLLENGAITASWNDATIANLKDDAVIFSVKVNALNATEVSDVFAVNSAYTMAEAYSTTEELGVALEFHTANGSEVAGGEFELYQNQPNPFAKVTTVAFNLPTAGTATLSIYDVSGKVIRTFNGNFAKGYNEINVSSDELSANGMLYYRLESANHTATRKMIIVK